MEQEILEELVKENPEHPTFLLFLLIQEEHEMLKALYHYKIYGKQLTNFLNLCESDLDTMKYSLKIITTRPFITKEMVKNNLLSKNPIKFTQEKYDPKFGTEEFYIHHQGLEFLELYENNNNQKKSR